MVNNDTVKFWEKEKGTYIPECNCPDCTRMRNECFDLCYTNYNNEKCLRQSLESSRNNDKKKIQELENTIKRNNPWLYPIGSFTSVYTREDIDRLKAQIDKLTAELRDEKNTHIDTKLSRDIARDNLSSYNKRVFDDVIPAIQSVINILDKIDKSGYSLVTGSLEWCVQQLKK